MHIVVVPSVTTRATAVMYQVVYLVIVVSLGVLAVVVSLWDKFGTPRYRPLRAGGHHRLCF